MDKEVMTSSHAPRAIGPYSIAIRTRDWLFTSGQLGLDPLTSRLVPGGIEAETCQALTNLKNILADTGSSMDKVIKTTVFMKDLADFPKMNAIYAEFFPSNPPARSTVQVAALPLGALIEVEAIAVLRDAR